MKYITLIALTLISCGKKIEVDLNVKNTSASSGQTISVEEDDTNSSLQCDTFGGYTGKMYSKYQWSDENIQFLFDLSGCKMSVMYCPGQVYEIDDSSLKANKKIYVTGARPNKNGCAEPGEYTCSQFSYNPKNKLNGVFYTRYMQFEYCYRDGDAHTNENILMMRIKRERTTENMVRKDRGFKTIPEKD